MRNMSKKTWKLRVWNHMTEMQKLDILLKHAKVLHTYERRWPEMDRPDNQEFLPGGRHDGGEQIIACLVLVGCGIALAISLTMLLMRFMWTVV